MKYLGHDTNSRNDIKVRKLIKRHGFKGFGVYWAINEIIAEKVESTNLDCILEHSIEDLADEFNDDPDSVRTIAGYCTDLGLLTLSKNGKNYQNTKILKRLDEYTKKRIRTVSGHTPDSIQTVSPEKKERKEVKEKNEMKTEVKEVKAIHGGSDQPIKTERQRLADETEDLYKTLEKNLPDKYRADVKALIAKNEARIAELMADEF